MSRETEKIFKEIEKRLKVAGPISETERKRIVKEVVKEFNEAAEAESDVIDTTSVNLLDMAYDEEDIEEAKRLAQMAIMLDESNTDAKIFLASLGESPLKIIENIETVISDEKERLGGDDYFNENMGSFWGFLETRPYMRANALLFHQLKDMCRCREAVRLSEYMLELNENDNLGVRYELMGLYAMLEEFHKGEELFSRFEEESLLMLLPFAILKYRQGEYEEADDLLDRVNESNEYILPLLMGEIEMEEGHWNMYSPGSIEEAHVAFDTFQTLLLATSSIIVYISEVYNR